MRVPAWLRGSRRPSSPPESSRSASAGRRLAASGNSQPSFRHYARLIAGAHHFSRWPRPVLAAALLALPLLAGLAPGAQAQTTPSLTITPDEVEASAFAGSNTVTLTLTPVNRTFLGAGAGNNVGGNFGTSITTLFHADDFPSTANTFPGTALRFSSTGLGNITLTGAPTGLTITAGRLLARQTNHRNAEITLSYSGAAITSDTVVTVAVDAFLIRKSDGSGDHGPALSATFTLKAATASTEPEITIAAGTSPVTEGTAATYTLTASPAPTSNLDVEVTVADAPNADFVTAANQGTKTVRIPSGSTTATVTVPTDNGTPQTPETTDEPNGPVKVTVETGTGYTVGTADEASVTVNDNDATTVTLTGVRTATVERPGNIGNQAGRFSINLNRALRAGEVLVIPFQFSGGTLGTDFRLQRLNAVTGVAYNANTGVVTFTGSAGGSNTNQHFWFIAENDADRADESIGITVPGSSESGTPRMTATGLGGGASGSGSVTITVNDDDPAPTLSIVPNKVTVLEGGAARTYTVALANDPRADVTVTAATRGGGAAAVQLRTDGAWASSATLSFTGGGSGNWGTAQTVEVRGTPNDGNTDPETVTVSNTVTVPTNSFNRYHGARADVTVSVADAQGTQALVGFSETAVSINEGDGDLVLTVTKTGNPAAAVAYATADVTASGGSDYTATSGTLTWAAGDSASQTITVPILDDSLHETSEAFRVSLSSVAGTPTVIVDSGHTATILDNDAAPTAVTLSLNPTSVSEGAGATTVTVTATVGGTTRWRDARTVRVSVAGSGGTSVVGHTAVADFDLVIPGGDATATETFELTPTDDGTETNDETITVSGTLTDVTVASADLTIEDDDGVVVVPTVALTVSGGGSVTEGGTLTITATRSEANASGAALVIPIRVKTGDTTAQGADYSFPASISIADGEATGTATFTASQDTGDEPPETVTVELGAVPSGTVAGSPREVAITIADDDATEVTLAGAGGDVTEGRTKEITITLGRGLVSGETLPVPLVFGSAAGDATRGTDYTLACPDTLPTGVTCTNLNSGANPRVTFTGPSNGMTAASVTLTLTATPDSTVETGGETVDIDLGTLNASSGTGLGGGASGTDNLADFDIVDPATADGVTVSESTLALTEGHATDGTKTYTVRLATDPGAGATVTVTAMSGDTTSATVSPGSYSFTGGGSGTWGTARTFTVTAVEDGDTAGETFNVTHTATASPTSNDYHQISVDPVAVTVTDAGSGVIVDPQTLDVRENGGTATYSIRLLSAPGGPVTITPDSSDDSHATVSGALTFNNGNWATAQDVTVTAAGAATDTATITNPITTGTTAYPTTTSVDDVEVTLTADARPVVSIAAGDPVTEGTDAEFTVTVDPAPASGQSLTVRLLVIDGGGDRVDAADIGPKTVTVDDSGSAVHSVPTQGDGNDTRNGAVAAAVVPPDDAPYRRANGDYVSVVILDDDPTSVTLARSGTGAILEEGGTATVTVTLGRRMFSGESVTVPLTVTGAGIGAGDYTLTLAPGSNLNTGVALDTTDPHSAAQPAVTFTGHGVNTVQVATLTLTAVGDEADEGTSETLTVGFGADARAVMSNLDRASGTGTGGTTPTGTAVVEIADNDDPAVADGVTVSETSLALTEGHATDGTKTYTVRLATDPGSGVTVTVTPTSGDTTSATVSPASYSFTGGGSGTWGTAQTFTVTALEDGDTANEAFNITHAAVAPSGNAYNAISIPAVAVTVTDAGSGVIVDPQTLDVRENGGTATYSIRLLSAPGGPVTITPRSGDTSHATVSGAISFTDSDWQTPKDVTVTAAGAATDEATITNPITTGTTAYPTTTSVDDVEVTLTSDARSLLTLSLSSTGGAEGSTGYTDIDVTVTRPTPVGGPADVFYELCFSGTATRDENGTKTAAEDYQVLNYSSGNAVQTAWGTGARSGCVGNNNVGLPTDAPSQTWKIRVFGDAATEPDETVVVTLRAGATNPLPDGWGISGAGNPATYTIDDAGTGPEVSIGLPSVEGVSRRSGDNALPYEESAETVTFNVSADPAPASDLEVCLAVTETGGDRIASSAKGTGLTVTIPAGTLSVEYDIAWTDTAADDRDSVVTLTALAPSHSACSETGYTVSATEDSDLAVIVDDEQTEVTLAATDAAMTEADAADTAEVTVTLGRRLYAGEVVVAQVDLSTSTGARLPDHATPDFAVSAAGSGVALAGASTVAPQVTFTGHDTNTVRTATLTFTPVAGRADADTTDETVTAALATNAVLGGLSGTNVGGGVTRASGWSADLTIEDRPQVTLTVSGGGSVTEGGSLTVTATRSQANPDTSTLFIPIRIKTADTTAQPGDYAFPHTTIGIASGATSGTRTFTAIDDSADEPAETVVIELGTLPAGTVVGAAGEVEITIGDGDATTVVLAGPDGNVTEGDTKEFTVTLGRGLVDGEALAVPLAFAGTATRGTDYTTACPGTPPTGVVCTDLNNVGGGNNPRVTFTGPASGMAATSVTLTLTAATDSISENGGESVEIDLGTLDANSGTGLGGGASGTDSLDDFDIVDAVIPTVALTVSGGGSVTEGQTLTLTATRSAANASGAALAIPIRVKTADTTAQSADYSFPTSISIANNATTGTATFTANQDTGDEPAETVTVELHSLPSGTAAGSPGEAAITIADDDATAVTLAGPPGDVTEGDTKEITVTLGRGLVDGEILPVPLAFAGAATRGTDYTTACPGTLPTGVACDNLNSGVNPRVTFTGPANGMTATSVTLTLTAATDSATEAGGESVEIGLGTLNANSGTGLGGGASATDSLADFRILDPVLTLLSLDVSSSGGAEGDAGHTDIDVTVSKPAGSADAFYELCFSGSATRDEDGAKTAAEDYQVLSRSAGNPVQTGWGGGARAGCAGLGGSVPMTSDRHTWKLRVFGDTAPEPSETVVVTLRQSAANPLPQGWGIDGADNPFTYTIADDEQAPPCSNCVWVTGGPDIEEGGVAEFTVRANPVPAHDLTVQVFVRDAGSRSDFVLRQHEGLQHVQIRGGEGETVLGVPTQDDAVDEPDHSVGVDIRGTDRGRNGGGWSIPGGRYENAAVQVRDNDGPPSVPDYVIPGVKVTGFVSDSSPRRTQDAYPGEWAYFLWEFVLEQDGHGNDVYPAAHRQRMNVSGEVVSSVRGRLFGGSLGLSMGEHNRSFGVAVKAVPGETLTARVLPAGYRAWYSPERPKVLDYRVVAPSSHGIDVALKRPGTEAAVPPVLTLAPDAGSVTEGGTASFTITADRAPQQDVTVHVTAEQSMGAGADRIAVGRAEPVLLRAGETSVTWRFTAYSDDRARAHGTIEARIDPGPYKVGVPSTATVTLLDDDGTPAPPNLGGTTPPGVDPALVAKVRSYAAETHHGAAHVHRWKRVLVAFGVESYPGVAPMTVAEAQALAGLPRWVPIPAAIQAVEDAKAQAPDGTPRTAPEVDPATGVDPALVAKVRGYAAETHYGAAHVHRWKRVLVAFGVESYPGVAPMTVAEARARANLPRWAPIPAAIQAVEDAKAQQPQQPVVEPAVTVAAGASPVTEGGDAVFTITATPAPSAPLAVTVAVAADGDWGVSAGDRTVTIPASGSATLTLATADDTADEPDGSVSATVKDGSGYTVGAPASGSVVIRDDDDPPPAVEPAVTIAAGASPVTEGGDAVFTITATPAPSAPLAVTVAVAADGAWGVAAGERTVTIPASGSATLTLATADDAADEPDGSVSAAVKDGNGYAPGSPASATVAVRDNDEPAVAITAGASPVTEGGDAVFTITATPAPHAPLAVTVAVAADGDWGVAAGERTVTIPATGSAVLTLATADDAAVEPDGSVSATVKDGSGYSVGAPASASVAVLDDDEPAVTVAAGTSPVTEGGDAVFTITASPAPSAPLAVTVAVAASGDYGVAAGERTVTIPASGSVALTLATADDGADEADGSVSVTVRDGDGYTVGAPASATVAVLDNDEPAVSIAAGASPVTEGGDAVFTLTASPVPHAPLDVTVAVAADGAWGVAAGERTVTIPTGGSATLTLATTDDTADEPNGSVSVTVKDGDGYAVGAPASGTVAVLDDDEPPPVVTIAAKAASIAEGGDAVFTVTADRAPASDLAVRLTVTETGGGDHVDAAHEGARTAVIAGGATAAEVTVPTVNDTVDEPDGTVTAALKAGEGYTLGGAASAEVKVADDDDPAPALSIGDATAREGGTMTFTVRLSAPAARTVSLFLATRETVPASARAGADFQQVGEWNPYWMTILPGRTVATWEVMIFDDFHDDGGETFEAYIVSAQGAPIADGVAVGTIENDDPLPAAWLKRFGRTVAQQALDGIADRMTASRTAGFEGTLAGQALSFDPNAGGGAAGADETASGDAALAMAGVARSFGSDAGGAGGTGPFGAGGRLGNGDPSGFGGPEGRSHAMRSRTMTARDALLGSSFSLTGEKDGRGGTLAFWGRASQGSFDGVEQGDGADIRLDGTVTTGLLGADYARDRWLVGLALAQSAAEGDYAAIGAASPCPETGGEATDLCDGGVRAGDGTIEASLTAAIPYAAWRASDRLRLWGAAGYGTGEVTLRTDPDQTYRADTSWSMAAAGVRGDLLAPADGGPALAVTSDALWARTSSEKTRDLAASESDVTRLRLGLEGSYGLRLEGGGELTPRLEAGVRHDGGDAESGFGVELGGGVAWVDPGLGLKLDLSGRTLLAHEDDAFRDRGYSASLAFDPAPATGRGPSLTLRQDWGGEAAGGLDALFAPDPLAERAGDGAAAPASRWTMEAAYGLPILGGRFTGSPHAGFGLSTGARDWTLGWRLAPEAAGAPDFSFGLQATRRESDTAPPEHTLGFEIRATW